ncbi:MAG TPA: hypothetical protein VNO75_00515 [Gemmatimonadaceae bacterium]|nr:hypothetical protein [Gemmatimonadaceae bacterium]
MISSRVFRSFALVLAASLTIGCGDSPTAPPAASAPVAVDVETNELLGGLLGGLLRTLTNVVQGVLGPTDVTPIRWASTHDNTTRQVSGTIGYRGGTLAIPSSDFTITFPYGALRSNTNITIISDARGGYVSYAMQPHGIRFSKPVVVTQRLRNTEAYRMRNPKLFGAYLGKESVGLLGGLLNGVIEALEIVTSVTILRPDGTPEVQTWLLNHFSRYVLASG